MAVAGACLALAACDADASLSPATGDPCAAEYAGFCGASCADGQPCSEGLHCAGALCTAQCSPQTPCRAGYRCDEAGRCLPSGRADAADGGGVDAQGNDDPACVQVEVQFEQQVPTVMLLVDRSGSMDAGFPGAANRWEAVKEALIDPDDGVVKLLEDRVRFGLMLYTSDGGGPDCPQLIGDDVPIALHNYAAIAAVYGPTDYFDQGDTPTAEAIVAARQALAAFSEPGPKVIVLATDGEPDTCEDSDAHNPTTNQRSVQTVQETYAMDIGLSVLAVGDDVGASHLQDLANAGAGRPLDGSAGNAPAYAPSDRAGLVADFSAIINGVRSCVVDLDHAVSDGQAARGTVELDGTALPFEDPDGWRLRSPTSLELSGEACERLKQDAGGLRIRFPCDVVVPI